VLDKFLSICHLASLVKTRGGRAGENQEKSAHKDDKPRAARDVAVHEDAKKNEPKNEPPPPKPKQEAVREPKGPPRQK
jgi:hypothetical protein